MQAILAPRAALGELETASGALLVDVPGPQAPLTSRTPPTPPAAELIVALGHSLRHHEHISPDAVNSLDRCAITQWEIGFFGGDGAAETPPLRDLSAAQLLRLAKVVRSRSLARVLLHQVFPKLLVVASKSSRQGASEGAAEEARAISTAIMTNPLPSHLKELLSLLLQSSAALTLEASTFDQEVLPPLLACQGPLGQRAAAQAALEYVACHMEEGQRRSTPVT